MILQSRTDILGNSLLAQMHGMQFGIINRILVDARLCSLTDSQIQTFEDFIRTGRISRIGAKSNLTGTHTACPADIPVL